jgi:hypothetical protein
MLSLRKNNKNKMELKKNAIFANLSNLEKKKNI